MAEIDSSIEAPPPSGLGWQHARSWTSLCKVYLYVHVKWYSHVDHSVHACLACCDTHLCDIVRLLQIEVCAFIAPLLSPL